jgi:xanthine dehydrogenase YagT iron-sulfur-binding subunit
MNCRTSAGDPCPYSPPDALTLNRRALLGASAALAWAGGSLDAQAQAAPQAPTAGEPRNPVPVRCEVNGKRHVLMVDARASLLDTLREQLDLTGAKKGCDHGQCGACTVHVDGRRVASCLTLAAQVDGKSVTTIEGIGGPRGELHPMQQAFIDHDALQCGYCTPGQIMAAIACVREGHAGSAAQIQEYMSGNICRCGAYRGIVAAIQQAAPVLRRRG